MKKYNEEYFSVVEKRTGRKIADCGEWSDARMLLHLDPQNREVRKNKFLMAPVVDIEIPKALPTNEISIDTTGYKKHQEEWMVEKINQLPQIKLPEGQGKVFNI
jgi:hypothetical protein